MLRTICYRLLRLFSHRTAIGKARLENEFGLNAITIPHALKGTAYLEQNPKARTEDLMAAFKDNKTKAIISMNGEDDAIH